MEIISHVLWCDGGGKETPAECVAPHPSGLLRRSFGGAFRVDRRWRRRRRNFGSVAVWCPLSFCRGPSAILPPGPRAALSHFTIGTMGRGSGAGVSAASSYPPLTDRAAPLDRGQPTATGWGRTAKASFTCRPWRGAAFLLRPPAGHPRQSQWARRRTAAALHHHGSGETRGGGQQRQPAAAAASGATRTVFTCATSPSAGACGRGWRWWRVAGLDGRVASLSSWPAGEFV